MASSAEKAHRKLIEEEMARLKADPSAMAEATSQSRSRAAPTPAAASKVAQPASRAPASPNQKKGGGTGSWERDKAEAERKDRVMALKARTASLLESTKSMQGKHEKSESKARKQQEARLGVSFYGSSQPAAAAPAKASPSMIKTAPGIPSLQAAEEPEYTDAELLEMVDGDMELFRELKALVATSEHEVKSPLLTAQESEAAASPVIAPPLPPQSSPAAKSLKPRPRTMVPSAPRAASAAAKSSPAPAEAKSPTSSQAVKRYYTLSPKQSKSSKYSSRNKESSLTAEAAVPPPPADAKDTASQSGEADAANSSEEAIKTPGGKTGEELSPGAGDSSGADVVAPSNDAHSSSAKDSAGDTAAGVGEEEEETEADEAETAPPVPEAADAPNPAPPSPPSPPTTTTTIASGQELVYRPMAGYLSMSIASSGAGGGKPSKAVQRWVTLEPHGMRLSVMASEGTQVLRSYVVKAVSARNGGKAGPLGRKFKFTVEANSLTVGAVCSPSQSPLATSSSAVASPTQVTTTPTKSHKNTSNSGKSDEATTAAAVTARPSKKAELEKELAAAVEEEDYDRAADIQEELEALEKEEINEVEDIGALERAAVARAAKIVELENKKKVALGNNNFKLLSVIKGELSALEKEAKWDSLSPAKRQAALARSNKKTELERVLATAVEEEDYDRAADIQDELKLLEDEEKAAEVESKGIDEHDSAKVATSTRSPAIPQQPSSGTTEPAAVFTVGPAVTLTFVTSPASDAAAWVYALNQGQQTHEEAAKAAAQSAGVVSPNRNASAKSPSHASTSSGPAGAPTSSTTNSPSPAQASPRRWGFFGRKKQGTTTSTAANTAATPSSSSAASAPRSRLPAVAVVKGSESEESAAQKIQNLARGRRARKRTAVKRAQRGASFRAAPAVDVDASSDSEEAEENDDDDSDVSIGDVSSDDDDEKA